MFLLRPSLKSFLKEANRIPNYPLFERLHGYIYMRFPYLYIGIGTGEHPLSPLFRFVAAIVTRLFPPKPGSPSFADTYHGKVIPLETARQLVTVREEIRVSYPERVIPYTLARDLILQQPDHIVVLDCPCRASREHPCLPLDVCLIIGEPFASMVIEHHPKRSRWISQEEALNILEAEEERGHVHHAFFKQAVLGRFYAICNCCSCCCGAIQAHQNGTPMLAASGYVSRVNEELCIGCGTCNEYCQFGALELINGHTQINTELCMGCGVCVSHCPQGALSLILDTQKGEPLRLPTRVL